MTIEYNKVESDDEFATDRILEQLGEVSRSDGELGHGFWKKNGRLGSSKFIG